MKRILKGLVFSAALLLSAPFTMAQEQLVAFPGAEGFGRFATGARGGTIYHVTNLDDSGAGSFRDAVSGTNRIIIFDVAGTIVLKSPLVVKGNNTILGQTAPGEGIQVYGDRVSFSGANNLIVRHMRFRMGIKGASGKDACGIANGTNMIFDHCSVLWGRDENFSVNWDKKGDEPGNITIQNSIIGQGLQTHSCGGLIQTSKGVTLFRNLYIENKTRNPKVKGLNQYVNNVVYNWGNGGCYIMGETEGASWAHIENNYFINGPWNNAVKPFIRGSEAFHYYGAGNYYDDNKDGVLNGHLMTEDEQRGWLRNKVVIIGGKETTQDWASTPVESLDALNRLTIHEVIHKSEGGVPVMDQIQSEQDVTIATPIPVIESMMSAEEAFHWIAANVGASLPVRDEVDQYLIDELLSYGKDGTKNGISSELSLPHKGTGIISGGVKPLDTDNDGMPDAYETANGLNPNDPADATAIAANGYMNIENYSFTLTAAYPYIKKPVNLSVASIDKTTATLKWELNGNTTDGFIIEAAPANGEYTEVARADAGATEVTVLNLTPETAYSFRIRAYNADGLFSDYSDAVSAETTGDPTLPKKSTNPSIADGSKVGVGNGITLTWDNDSKNYAGTVYYTVNLGQTADAMTVVAENLTERKFTPELEANKTYYWRVDAKNDLGTTQGDVWSFSTTNGGVLFYADFAKHPAAFAEKYGNITGNVNIFNGATNQAVDFDGMIIGCGDAKMRVVALNANNCSDDLNADYGPATEEDRGASPRAIQFVTTAAGGFVESPEVQGPCAVTLFIGNPDGKSATVKVHTIVNGETVDTQSITMTKKRIYKLTTNYLKSGAVKFRFDANAKKTNVNDFLVERYVYPEGDEPLELKAGELVNDNLSYADGAISFTFNQEIKYNGNATVSGKHQYEDISVSGNGTHLTVNYEALDVNSEYVVTIPSGAVTNVKGDKEFAGTITLRTSDFGPAKAQGETHFGKAIAALPANFKPFDVVAPFATEGSLVQEKQNDYPHWVQASGEITAEQAVMSKTSDKVMAYYGPRAAKMYLSLEAEGACTVKIQESRNCDVNPGWRTVRVLHETDMPFNGEIALNPESHFIKILPASLSGTLTVKNFVISDDKGDFGDSAVKGIEVDAEGSVEVFSVSGVRLGEFESISDVRLPSGLYIVKSANGVRKLAL